MIRFSLSNPQWSGFRGAFDSVPEELGGWLSRLWSNGPNEQFWNYLWDQLHHQGDVGEASYAVVTHLAEYTSSTATNDWQFWGFPAVVELARLQYSHNPKVPDVLSPSYEQAFRVLSTSAINLESWSETLTPVASSCIALSKQQPIFARAYLEMATQNSALHFLKEEVGWEP